MLSVSRGSYNFHLVLDSYLERAFKSAERLLRSGGTVPLEYDEPTADLTIPEQMKKFWSSPTNKVLLQKLAREKV